MRHGVGGLLVLLLLAVGSAAQGQEAHSWNAKASSPPDSALGLGASARVVVAPTVLEQWNYLYRYVNEVEFVLCLEGEQRAGRTYIEAFRLARMDAADANSVRYEPCTESDYIGTAHNHPPSSRGGGLCYPSVPDRESFAADRRAVVDVILCGENRVIWSLKDGTAGGTPEALAAARATGGSP